MKSINKTWKVALDALMLIGLTLMFKKMVVSMAFHEIAGLAIIILFIVHHLVNGKWITNVSKCLFKKETPLKTKVQYAVDALLLVAFVLILISGVLISKVVFQLNVHGDSFKTIHYFCSALAVVLSGVHIGLHLKYLFGACMKCKVKKVALTALTVLILGFGIYSIATTSFVRWLSMPFQNAQMGQIGFMEGMEQPPISGELMQPQPPSGEEGSRLDAGAYPGKGTGNGQGRGNGGVGQGLGQGQKMEGQGQGDGRGKGSGRGQESGFGQALLLIANYLSMIGVFAGITGGVEWLIKRGRSKHLQPVTEELSDM